MVAILYCFLNGEVSPSQNLGAREQSLVAPGSKTLMCRAEKGQTLLCQRWSSD